MSLQIISGNPFYQWIDNFRLSAIKAIVPEVHYIFSVVMNLNF
jgi:hypothetical protein